MDHGSMPMSNSTSSMDMGAKCKISMLWNWNTVDACFIARTWQITSTSMFAGSCVGVVLLVMSLELLRRLGKEYDRLILRQFQRHIALLPEAPMCASNTGIAPTDGKATSHQSNGNMSLPGTSSSRSFRPNLFQQAIRATLHMLQFSVAYFVMLLAMYYNGYFIICIIIGAWLGAFVFGWENVDFEGPRENPIVCCG